MVSHKYVAELSASLASPDPDMDSNIRHGRVAIQGRNIYIASAILFRDLTALQLIFFGPDIIDLRLSASGAAITPEILAKPIDESADVPAYFGIASLAVVHERLGATDSAYEREFITAVGKFTHPYRPLPEK